MTKSGTGTGTAVAVLGGLAALGGIALAVASGSKGQQQMRGPRPGMRPRQLPKKPCGCGR